MHIEITAEQAEAFRKAGVPVKAVYTIALKDVVAAQFAKPASLSLPPDDPKPRVYKTERVHKKIKHLFPRGTVVRMSAQFDKTLRRYAEGQHQRQTMEAVRMVLTDRGNEPMLRSELFHAVRGVIGDNAIGRGASSALTLMLETGMLEVVNK